MIVPLCNLVVVGQRAVSPGDLLAARRSEIVLGRERIINAGVLDR